MIFKSLPLIFFVLCFHSFTTADLNSDEEALLTFAASVSHIKRLNWSHQKSICSSWIGVRCTTDNTRVRTLKLPGFGLNGSIRADTLGKLDALEVLSLRFNYLIDLPPDVSTILSLRSLFLQHNNLPGIMPSLSSRLNILDLSYNSLKGAIPQVFENLTQIRSLFLQNNSLSGPIPDLQLPNLKHLNLSYNNLSGAIPLSLQGFPKESFLGNPFLCGTPLPQCPETPGHKRSIWKTEGVTIAIASGVSIILILLVILILVCFFKRKHRQQSSREPGQSGTIEKPEGNSSAEEPERRGLVFFDKSSHNFDLEDLLRASAESIGKGSHGTTYKAFLEDGTTVVVKRLKDVVIRKREFEQHMEMIGRIRLHPNIVPLLAYYYSNDDKLLIYDYVPSGSFSSLLHGSKVAGCTHTSWESRVKVALGAARGIAHIHIESGGNLVHGNIKSSNILLTPELDARVCDYGLAPLFGSATALTPSRIVVGYSSPEVIETRQYTYKSDVYSFGVLLLEMLTGRAPLRSPGHDDLADLPRWVQFVVREEWTTEVFDAELMLNRKVEEEMVRMLQIAMSCIATTPDQRPTMEEVMRMIEGIRRSDSGQTVLGEEQA
ncbi:probable inactive receptor kinase At5g58300 [Zingiber officinale]|nr:probable inactive receptor kinase At5g58300 [Zingiber officinale]